MDTKLEQHIKADGNNIIEAISPDGITIRGDLNFKNLIVGQFSQTVRIIAFVIIVFLQGITITIGVNLNGEVKELRHHAEIQDLSEKLLSQIQTHQNNNGGGGGYSGQRICDPNLEGGPNHSDTGAR